MNAKTILEYILGSDFMVGSFGEVGLSKLYNPPMWVAACGGGEDRVHSDEMHRMVTMAAFVGGRPSVSPFFERRVRKDLRQIPT